jgi:hypothetical protein
MEPSAWSSLGEDDNAAPVVQEILDRTANTMEALRKAQVTLTAMRHGPGPDGTPPVVEEATRADGLWPFLLIRHEPGDTGSRPLDAATRAIIGDVGHFSPDILVTEAGPANEPTVVDRDEFPALQARSVSNVQWNLAYDIWVHVWNLGKAPATGVRVRAWMDAYGRYLGGRNLDLGDRLSSTCHRVVKVATYTANVATETSWELLTVVAECLSDPASGDRAPGMDRHCGHSWLIQD